jgi:hypothetical protein
MKYSLDHNKNMDICIIRVWGAHKRPDDSMELQRVASDFKAENGCSKYLFDMRETMIEGDTFSTYDTATAPLSQGMKPYEYRVALVYTGDLSQHKFMELVAVNRGYSLKVFDGYERAMSWLNHGQPGD